MAEICKDGCARCGGRCAAQMSERIAAAAAQTRCEIAAGLAARALLLLRASHPPSSTARCAARACARLPQGCVADPPFANGGCTRVGCKRWLQMGFPCRAAPRATGERAGGAGTAGVRGRQGVPDAACISGEFSGAASARGIAARGRCVVERLLGALLPPP